jgi:hypothetical protein
MIFVQESIYQDYIFGKQIIRFVVSDNYDDLFKTDAQIVSDLSIQTADFRTNIFNLGKSKETLKKDKGSFSMSELGFTVTTSAVKNITDKRAMFFCLHANNFRKHRYCATFLYPLGSSFDESDRTFTGKLSSTITGDEFDWKNASPWDFEIEADMEINFKAFQFDLSIMNECLLDEDILLPDGTETGSIYSRLTDKDGGNGDLETAFKHKPSYIYGKTGGSDGFIIYTSPQGTIYDSLMMLLDKTSEVLDEMLGTTFSFDIVETDLGISVRTAYYELKDQANGHEISELKTDGDIIDLHIAPTGSPNYDKNPYISSTLLKPVFGTATDIHTTKENMPEIYRYHESNSFLGAKNITTVLAEVARALGCVVVTRFVSGTGIEIEFVSKNTLAGSSNVYIIGANNSSFDSSSIALEDQIVYYAEANRLILEGGPDREIAGDEENTYKYQQFDPGAKDYFGNFKPTPALEEFRDKIRTDSLIEYKRLILSTSYPVTQIRFDGGVVRSTPLNHGVLFTTPYESTPYSEFYDPSKYTTRSLDTLLNSGIMVKTTPQSNEQVTLLGASTPVWQPASDVVVNINGENVTYKTLSEYVTSLNDSDKLYYENTRKITVPTWNGFSASTDGSNPSWKNIKIGQKLPLKVKTLEYDEVADEWNEVWSPVTNWSIVSLERSMDKPETTIELVDESVHSIYGNYDSGKGSSQVQGTVNQSPLRNGTVGGEISETWVFKCNEVIKADYAVALRDDGRIEKFQPLKSTHYNKFIGIAKQDGITNDVIRVQTSGIVVLENLTIDENKSLFVRYATGNNANLQQTILESKTADEDMIFRLCRKPLNNRAFHLKPEYMIYG